MRRDTCGLRVGGQYVHVGAEDSPQGHVSPLRVSREIHEFPHKNEPNLQGILSGDMSSLVT